jgi:hypothetical protein
MNMNKITRFTRSLLPITLIGTLPASAETWFLQSPTPQSLNRFGASFRAAFNVEVEFKNVGAFVALPGRLTLDGDAYNYDDGYVLEDSTQNTGGFTRYWGYDNASQVPGDGTILMSTYSSSGATASEDDKIYPGGEITYSRILGGGDNWRWGLETALNYMNFSAHDSSTASASVTRLSDAYALPPLEGGGFVNPPPAPYQGRYELQPEGNPVIGATQVGPTSMSTVTAPVTGSRRFEADVFGLRFGPFLEVPLGGDLFLTISGGLSLAEVRSDFKFNDTTAIVNGISAAGSGSDQNVQMGAYVAGNMIYKLGGTWELFGGVQYQDVGRYSHKENGRKAVLDLSKSLFVVLGASVSF